MTMFFSKALLLLLLSFCSYTVLQAQVSIFAGPQITTANYSIRNADQPTESKPGFMAGIRLTTQIEGPVYFSPSLYYSRKGYKVTFNQEAEPPALGAKNNNTVINTIAFAPLLQFNLSKAKTHLFVRFGPGMDVAFSGTETFDSTGNKRVQQSMRFGSTAYSPITLYGNIHLGFQHRSGFGFFAHYEHGLSNLNNNDYGPAILHRIAGVSVEWRFGK